MGNSSSASKIRISPGEDALQTLTLSTAAEDGITSELPDNTILLNESFLSFDLSTFEDECPKVYSELVPGEEESPESLHFRNLHVSFLASFFNGNTNLVPRSQDLLDVLNSHRWSIQSQEYVAMCASFILSILKIYGQCIPQDSQLINERSFLMFHILDDLHNVLSKMKINNWHVDSSWIKGTCHDCEISQMVLKRVNLRKVYKEDKFCLVCLQFTSHVPCKTALHIQLKAQFIQDVYPYPCVNCDIRFSKERDLLLHSSTHDEDFAVRNDKLTFTPSFCFLCLIPCASMKDVRRHQKESLEHACRMEIAMELALRYSVILSASLSDSNGKADPETKTSPTKIPIAKKPSVIEANEATENVTSALKVMDPQYYCSPCSVYVPKANVVNHERGMKHGKACGRWISLYSQKNDPSMGEEKINGNCKIVAISELKDGSTSLTEKKKREDNVIDASTGEEKMNEKYKIVAIPGLKDGSTSLTEKKEREDNVMQCNDAPCSVPKSAKPSILDKYAILSLNTVEVDGLKAAHYVEEDGSSDQQVRKVIEEYVVTENVSRNLFSGEYVCSECFFEGNIYSIFGHVLEKHDIKSQWKTNEESLRLFEEKLKILSSLLSLCVKKQNYRVLKLINMEAMKKLIDIICLEQVEKTGAKVCALAPWWQGDHFKNFESGDSTPPRKQGYLPKSESCCSTKGKKFFDVSSSEFQERVNDLDEPICVGLSLPVDVGVYSRKETLEGNLKEAETSLPDMEEIYSIHEDKRRRKSNECDSLLEDIDDYFSSQKEINNGSSLFQQGVLATSKEGGSDNCLSLIEPKIKNMYHNSNEVLLDSRKLPGISKPEDLKKDCISVSESSESHCQESIEGNLITSEEMLEETWLPEIPGGFKEYEDGILLSANSEISHKSPAKVKEPSETSKLVEGAVNSDITDQDVLEAIEEYYHLDNIGKEGKAGSDDLYKCSKCNVTSISKGMLTHVLGKAHVKSIIKKQPVNVLEWKLELLAFFELVKMKSEVLQYFILHYHVLHNAEKMIRSKMKSVSPKASKSNTSDSQIVKLNKVTKMLQLSSKLQAPENIADNCVHPKMLSTENDEMEASRNTIVVGDSASASLQEQVQEICAGADLNDFETQCGTCGVVFQIFNDDIDFSLDMHIQNDPQHTLATAVPVDRNAQSMSELSKTINTSKPFIFNASKAPTPGPSQTEGRIRVIEAVLFLERKFISSKDQNSYICHLCSIQVNTDSQLSHHLLSPKHLSEKWMSCHTDEEMYEKYKHLSSLLTNKYATAILTIAMRRITFLRTREKDSANVIPSQCSPLKSQLVKLPGVEAKAPTAPFICPHCFTSFSNLSKPQRRKHRKALCKLNLIQSMESEAPKASKAPKAPSSTSSSSKTNSSHASAPKVLMFYCGVCKLQMIIGNKESHLSGKPHQMKLLKASADLAAQLLAMNT